MYIVASSGGSISRTWEGSTPGEAMYIVIAIVAKILRGGGNWSLEGGGGFSQGFPLPPV